MTQHFFGPINELLEWTLDEKVLNKLKGTGFDTLRGFRNDTRHCLPLINVLIKKYNTDSRSFILGSAESPFSITYGLEDVLYLTGLPISGKAVTGVDHADAGSLCQQYLGRHEGYGRLGHISLKWLKENFMTVGSDEELDYHVRAYVLYVIGCTFGADSCRLVSGMFLPLLENVDDIGSYAWGAALLANIHSSLGNPSTYLVGFYFSLMVFAYIRFPGLLSASKIDRTKTNEFPLVVSWSHALGGVQGRKLKSRKEEDIEKFFDNLKEEEVIWRPYAEFSSNFLPRHLKEQTVLAKSRTILICFEKTVYHRPDKCQRQLGLGSGHVLEGELIEIETKSRKGPKEKNNFTDWSKKEKYRDYIAEWEKRFDLLLDRDANVDAPEVTEVLVTDGDENVAPDLAESSVNDVLPIDDESMEEGTHPSEASIIAMLRKENENLKEEIEVYRKKFPEHLNSTPSVVAVGQTEPLITVISSDSDSENDVSINSDDDVSMTGSFWMELAAAKKSKKDGSESKSKNEAVVAASGVSHHRAFSSSNIGVYGKASDHPETTMISPDEIEAILLGGCI